jgi:hypothetical protein
MDRVNKQGQASPSKLQGCAIRLVTALAVIICLNSCRVPKPAVQVDDGDTIRVGTAEIFENADLQSSLDAARAQLASMTLISGSSVSAALSNIQGFSSSQSGVSLQALGSPTPQVQTTLPLSPAAASAAQVVTTQAATTPAAPAPVSLPANTAPTLAPAASNLLDRQLQLTSQVTGYELLLTGSDFSRFTTSGAPKDRIVIGIPITIYPGKDNYDQAAQITIRYFAPNSSQFEDPKEFTDRDSPGKAPRSVCDAQKYASKPDNPARLVDANALIACREQELSPTIVNILPTERSYDRVSVTSRAASLGVGMIVGTINAGASASSSRQTQYLVAQQETVALTGGANIPCPAAEQVSSESIGVGHQITCPGGAHGVEFRWQFRPVLGEHYVRTGQRRVFVQLAIPYSRRPYPHYGGVILVSRTWLPYDIEHGLVRQHEPSALEKWDARAVFGPPFFDTVVSDIAVTDIGGGSVRTKITGRYLLNARVRVGPAIFGVTSPGFAVSNNTLEFVTTAQSLTQYGATVMASGGVDTPLALTALCKAADPLGECILKSNVYPESANQFAKGLGSRSDPCAKISSLNSPYAEEHRMKVKKISITPASDSSSLVSVELCSKMNIEDYSYYEYFRDETGVVGIDEERKPNLAKTWPLENEILRRVNRLPIVVIAGGKTYGFSDLPFQTMSSGEANNPKLSFITSNDSLDSSPVLQIRRLYGDPNLDSRSVGFISPGRLRYDANFNRMVLP